MQKLRIVALKFGTGRQKVALEPKSRGVRVAPGKSYTRVEGKSAGVAKRPREPSPTRNPCRYDSQTVAALFRQGGGWVRTSRISSATAASAADTASPAPAPAPPPLLPFSESMRRFCSATLAEISTRERNPSPSSSAFLPFPFPLPLPLPLFVPLPSCGGGMCGPFGTGAAGSAGAADSAAGVATSVSASASVVVAAAAVSLEDGLSAASAGSSSACFWFEGALLNQSIATHTPLFTPRGAWSHTILSQVALNFLIRLPSASMGCNPL
jgi:hypothetical protein